MTKTNDESVRERDAAFAALQLEPENLQLARAYWAACGALRSRGDVNKAFQRPALASREGVVAFVEAWRELNDLSGGLPRPSEVGELVCSRVRDLLADPNFDGPKERLEWFLAALGEDDEDEIDG